jgi:protein-S-isoprenylcysteine O-methyltransferase Ste14
MSQPPLEKPNAAVALIKLTVFLLLLPGTVVFWAPRYLFRSAYDADPFANTASLAGGILLIALGVAGSLWCGLDFAFAGHGTPAPIDPPKLLVVRGLYRYARNPMYISVLLVLFGESAMFHSWTLCRYALVFWAGFHLFVLLYEEPTLRKKFGASYEDYCKGVNRWLPHPPRSSAL